MKKIEEFALQFLKQGRENWDVPHTRAVVYYAERLAVDAHLDVLVLTTTAWLHDIGYYGLFQEGKSSSLLEVKDKKVAHMEVGAKMAREFLENKNIKQNYTPEQIERVVHLVLVHDKIAKLKETDELIFMEADTLGSIDLSRVTPTFEKMDGLRYVEALKTIRAPKFVSKMGKRYLFNLLPKFEKYFIQM